MPNSFYNTSTINTVKTALDGLSLRQQLISRNLANVDTPGYQAQAVNFEKTLQLATEKSSALPLSTTHAAHLAAPRPVFGFQSESRPGGSQRADGNNVDIDVELMDMSETAIQYQALTQVIGRKYSMLKTIATR